MAADSRDIYEKMEKLVASRKIYLFEPLDDENPFEPYEGTPIAVGVDMAVKVTKGNDEVKTGDVVWLDIDDFCFTSIKEV